jgi:hypothetical protein
MLPLRFVLLPYGLISGFDPVKGCLRLNKRAGREKQKSGQSGTDGRRKSRI